MPGKLKILIFLAVALRLVLLLLVVENLRMNPDEEENYQIAVNNQAGYGYTLFNPEKSEYIQTSFHGSFPILMYEFLIRNNIPKEVWVLTFILLFAALYGISIYFLYMFARAMGGTESFSFYTAFVYSLYPSIVFYIGTTFSYENMVMPILIIVVFRLFIALQSGFKKWDYVLIPIVIVISCLFRPQMLVIYAFLMGVFVLLLIRSGKSRMLQMPFLVLVLIIVSHIPLLVKNKKQWGDYALSTQTGFELLQGHNPHARGSWMNFWRKSSSPLYQYVHAQIPGIDTLNEYQESLARKKLALDWIINNPLGEMKLAVRKILIYFIPDNYTAHATSNWLNPVNLMTHLLFVAGLFLILKSWKLTDAQFLMLAPVAGSIALTLVFFVGHRWRYYAEPFMIIIAMQTLVLLLKGRIKLNQ